MNPPVNHLLLIDDSPADNYIHRRRIAEAALAAKVVVKNNGREALDYLMTPDDTGHRPAPELIFLDINMPVMDGWEFLDHYGRLDAWGPNEPSLFLLTTSVTESDKRRADGIDGLIGYLEKPLTSVQIESVVRRMNPEERA